MLQGRKAIQGDSLLSTPKSQQIYDTHLINLRKMKG